MGKNKAYHHGDLRRALLDEGRRMILESGLDHLSLRAIARRAGVTHAAPYRHFPDKEALVAAIATKGFEDLCALMQETVVGCDEEPAEALLRMGVNYVVFALDHPAEFRTMWSPTLFDSGRFPELTQHAEIAREQFVRVLAAARHTDACAEDPGTTPSATCAWAMVHGLTSLLLDGLLGPIPREHVPAFVRVVLRRGHVGILSPDENKWGALPSEVVACPSTTAPLPSSNHPVDQG
jgi:AcrR family transcriptional regulator